MQVKELVSGGVAERHGGIERGDCILSVNRLSLTGLSTTEALAVLKAAGNHVTLMISRVAANCPQTNSMQELGNYPRAPHTSEHETVGGKSKMEGNKTLEHARRQAEIMIHQGSSQDSQSEPISVDYSHIESWRMSLEWSPQDTGFNTGETSDINMLCPLKQSPQLKKKFDTRNPWGEVLTFTDPKSTLPRKLSGTKAGLYLVELHKSLGGWLGIQLKGGKETPPSTPITIKAVLNGGAAHKNGQIQEEDEVIEVNGASFEKLSLEAAVDYMRSLPPGKVSMILRDHRKSRDLNFCRKQLFVEFEDNELQ